MTLSTAPNDPLSRARSPYSRQSIVVFGGRSEIGVEVAVRLARMTRGTNTTIVLAARRSTDLSAEVNRIRAASHTHHRHDDEVHVATIEFDANNTDGHADLIAAIERQWGHIDTAIVAFGILGDAARTHHDSHHVGEILHTDFVAQACLMTELANVMRPRRRGTIVAFSSVAGIRVRKANYVYGSAKAGLDGFVQGFSDCLHGSGITVHLVRPGFVVGNMTRALMESGTSPAPLSSTASDVADAVIKAIEKKQRLVWVPRALQPLFAVMRLLPQPLWRRMPR